MSDDQILVVCEQIEAEVAALRDLATDINASYTRQLDRVETKVAELRAEVTS